MAASNYLSKMTSGPLKDASVLALIRNCVNHSDSQSALDWLAHISNETTKGEADAMIRASREMEKE